MKFRKTTSSSTTKITSRIRNPLSANNLFGANFSALKEGNRVGTIEARDVRGRAIVRSLAIGDVVDWGSLRREEAFPSRNPLPRDPLWEIHGYGATAWLGGISRTTIALPDDLASLRITAAPSLPAGARLQIDSVEMLGR